MATYCQNGDVDSSVGKPSAVTPAKSGKKKCQSSNGFGNGATEFEDMVTLMHGSDPVRVELNRLENHVRDKERELGEAQAEIKGLKQSDRLKEKAVEELTDHLNKLDDKLKANEALLETKNLEIKKLNNEKKEAMAAQFAAEATLRRVHAAQKDDDVPPIEAILAPLEAELKLAKQQILNLQEDNKALDRLTKSKEAALLEAEKTVQVALAKASMVDDMQNKNQELLKQVEICQEENKILDKMQRQKVAEVEKLTQTVRELEEAVLAGGATANAVRDYQRRVQEMSEEMKILERELARAKVNANRVATVVANEWKDGNDKVMPVKQWLEERKFLQGEMLQLRDKLAVAERTAKAEAQLKEKYLLRFKVLEEQIKGSLGSSISASDGKSRRQSVAGAELSRMMSNGFNSRKAPVLRSKNASTLIKHAKVSSKSLDDGIRSYEENNKLTSIGKHVNSANNQIDNLAVSVPETDSSSVHCEKAKPETEDYVSGEIYDLLQKEVVSLKKFCQEKDKNLKNKEEDIELLEKKVDTLTKAIEVEARKSRREINALKEEVAAMRGNNEHELRSCSFSAPRGGLPRSFSLSARNMQNS